MSGYGDHPPSPTAVWDSAAARWAEPGWDAWLAQLQAGAEQIEWPGRAPGAQIPDEQFVAWWEWQKGKRPPGWTDDDEVRWRGGPGRSGQRCGVCGQRESDPKFWPLDLVAYANGLLVEACATCWLRWPHEHGWRATDPVRFPLGGAEPLTDEELRALARLPLPELVALLRTFRPGAAPLTEGQAAS